MKFGEEKQKKYGNFKKKIEKRLEKNAKK